MWLLPPSPSIREVWVSSTGSDTGRATSGSPLATLSEAVNRLAFHGGGTIYVTAPQASPLTEYLVFDRTFPLTIVPADGSRFWWAVSGTYACVRANGTGLLTVRKATLTGGTFANVVVGAAGLATGAGRFAGEDLDASGAPNGYATTDNWTAAEFTRCVAHDTTTNDGFNIHGTAGLTSTATLTDCEGYTCADQGASPHDDTIMVVDGGSFHDNVSSGIIGVGNSVMRIDGAEVYNNQTGGHVTGHGGISYFDATMSGYVRNTTSRDNTGPGMWIRSGATVEVTNVTSGLAAGNTMADNLAA